MPGGRRILSRIQSSSSYSSSTHKGSGIGGNHNGEEREPNMIPLASMVVLPKHASIPEIPGDSNLYFEVMLFIFGVIVMCLQFINLYKTVWWLPHSHSNYALNFYLIDPYLLQFLCLLMSRRLIACFVQEIYGSRSYKVLYWTLQLIKLLLVLAAVSWLAFTGYHVVIQHSPLYCLYLCCPLATYLILFGPALKPLYHKYYAWPKPVFGFEKSPPKSRNCERELGLTHSCTLTPDVVREEVESLKVDFNNRVKQVLFNSMLTAYYMAFVPLCFAQNTLYYDTWWVGQHVCLTWLSAFLMLIAHFLSPRYLDLLHKCALHLGRWQRVEGRHAHVPYNAWSELQVWPQGALVKHVRGLFKAEGVNVTAEPGNSMHSRFYFLFHKPLRVINWLLILGWLLVGYQFFRLLQCMEWSHIVSLALMLFCNYYTLFKLMRDRFIMAKCYKVEEGANGAS
ncbi:transmembrane protein 39A-like isoform X2 [Gigantopelta aegis]|uniref:transmembrane protein 39A-like isoform X2 n=1 Tax=Gigantopelta aegis TaxID=1735272 RepID=UPI001B8889F5|nr:transmembrane protein 39A-like isoform X2 [Gigantopelta aegis]